MNLSKRRSLKKKEEILKSAMKIINRRGYDGATMEEIAADLLMTKGSLYYYFKNKEDLMYQCHNYVLSEAAKELESYLTEEDSATETLRKMIFTHIDYVIEEKETYNLIIKPDITYKEEHLDDTLKLRKHYAGLFDQIIERGLSSGEFTVKEPVIARMFILGSMNWIQQWYNSEGRVSKEELQNLFCEYIMNLLKRR